MKHPALVTWGIAAAMLLSLGTARAAGQQNGGPGVTATDREPLAAVKALYASAAYEEALSAIDKVRSAPPGAGDTRGLDQYRAFCLLALGRDADATKALEDLVTADPFFLPDPNEVSPRVLTLFHGVRKRLLSGTMQARYAMAKATYDRKEFAAAADQFTRVLVLMNDEDMDQKAAGLADMKTLASGFLDLAKGAAAPPKPPAPVAPAPAPAPPPPAKSIFDGSDAEVAPPTVQRQDLPPFPLTAQSPAFASMPVRPGVIEIVIDETGRVQHVTMRQSITAAYDAMLLNAATNWRYNPALRDGKPVKYRKLIQVNVGSRK